MTTSCVFPQPDICHRKEDRSICTDYLWRSRNGLKELRGALESARRCGRIRSRSCVRLAHWLVDLARRQIWRLICRLLARGQESAKRCATTLEFVRPVELDSAILHRVAGRITSVFLDRHNIYRQHRLSLEAGDFRSAGIALAHFRAMEGARLGSDAGNSGH